MLGLAEDKKIQSHLLRSFQDYHVGSPVHCESLSKLKTQSLLTLTSNSNSLLPNYKLRKACLYITSFILLSTQRWNLIYIFFNFIPHN